MWIEWGFRLLLKADGGATGFGVLMVFGISLNADGAGHGQEVKQMKEWIKERWFYIKTYLWAMVVQVICLIAFDAYMPNVVRGFNIAYALRTIGGVFIFVLAHVVQVWWHEWRKHRKQ